MLNKKFVISLIGIYIAWLLVLPLILSKMTMVLCRNISHNTQYIVEIKNPKTTLSVLPVCIFGAENVKICTKDDSVSFELENFKVKIRLLPLISGKVHINDLSIENVQILANMHKEIFLKKDFFKKLETTHVKFDSVRINEFKALFYQKNVKTPIIYQGYDFVFRRTNRFIEFKTDSILNINDNISKVIANLYLPKNNDIKKTVFDLEISNINIAPLRNYFKYYLPKNLDKIQGEVNISANKNGFRTELSDCALIMKDSAKSIVFPNKFSIISKFKITKHSIDFENIDIESKNIHANLNGKLLDYFGKTMPTLDFNVILNKSKVEDIVNLLPPFKFEEIDIYKLKKYKFYGETLANFSIKGRLPEPDIIGGIYINDGILNKPIPNTSKGATIKLDLTGKHFNFDVCVPIGGLEKVFVKGSQELYNIKYADLTVKSTDSIDLKIVQNIVEPLHEILNFTIGPVPIMDINGRGNIDISVKGNRKKPRIWGVLNIKNGFVKFNDIPDLKFVNADAVIKFNDQNAVFTTHKGIVNGNDFLVNGNYDLLGNFDFNIVSKNQPLELIYKTAISSKMLSDIKKIIPKLDSVHGNTDLDLKIYGNVKSVEELQFNKNIFVKGDIELKNSDFELQNVEIKNANGKIKLDSSNAEADINATVGSLPLSIKAKVKNEIADLILDIPKLNPNFMLHNENHYLPYLSVQAKYNGSVNEIDYKKLNLESEILSSVQDSKIKYQSGGTISVNNGKITVKDVKGYIDNVQNIFDVNLSINNAFISKPEVDGHIKIRTPDLSLFNDILNSDIIPKNFRAFTSNFEFKKGSLNLDTRIFNNKINSNSDLTGISFIYLPLEVPIEIINGSLNIRNNALKLNKINLLADNMPVLVDGEIKDILGKQNFNLYFNSKPQQEFIDKYINKNQIYPIKIKGDIVYWLKLKGVPDDYDLKVQVDMSKDSSIYHFGATIGDIENAIAVSLESKITDGNNHKIKEFSYDKIIDSQSGRQTKLNMLKAWGGVEIFKDDLGFKDLHIKTNHPTDARIFNIIFRKPNIKQGQFTSDLKFNGKLSNPKVLGDFNISETNIPFLDTTMKNIELVFKDKTVEFSSKGEIMGNDIVFDGILKNKLTPPYKIEKASFYTKDLDLNQLVNKLKLAEVDNISTFESLEGFSLKSIVANNFTLKADNVQLRNIHATNFEALASFSDKCIFNIKNFNFNIAQGSLGGKYSYDFKNNDMGINLRAKDISANDISWALFDLNNQIYGDLTGDVNLTCNGTNFNHCMETLSGNAIFNVKDGRMPKLGSLEYLLKAGNLVKGGLTGLSINSVIDLITPLKTGEFSNIYGSIRIKDGIARNIEITSQGKDLSLFVGGTYNFATNIADMEVLGLLSRKISTMFGSIGNLSINTLFNVIPGVDLSKDSLILERINKIPAIELSNKTYRKFIAEIKGNINGDNYVTSFKWIN